MNRFLAAAAAAPLLLSAGASAQDELDGAEARERVLVINGERMEVGDNEAASDIIERALNADRPGRFIISMGPGHGEAWSDADREAFAEAMRSLGDTLANLDLPDAESLRFAWSDMNGRWSGLSEERIAEIQAHAETIRETALARAEVARERAMAAAMDGERMRLIGLRAGEAGMTGGLRGIEGALERGWTWERGERRELTDDERADLEAARDDLAAKLEEFRAEHGAALDLSTRDR